MSRNTHLGLFNGDEDVTLIRNHGGLSALATGDQNQGQTIKGNSWSFILDTCLYGFDSLVKWEKAAYENSQDYWQWHLLQAVNEAFCSLLTHKYVSIGCYPSSRQILLLEELPGSKCLRDDLKDEEEHGTHKGYTKLRGMMPIVHGHKYGASYSAIIYQCLLSLRVNAVEYFLLLYASRCYFSQTMAVSYAKQAVKLVDSVLMLGKVTVGRNKELTVQNLGASSCTTLLFSRYDPEPPLDVIVRKEISLMAKSHQS